MEGCEYEYEVFLSFRGPDTRTGITDHLYTRLVEAGVRTFKDDEDLPIGKKFGEKLLAAIEQSKISIPILSKDYASSTSCLDELAHIVKCGAPGKQIIMPIFYKIEPSDVRFQKGSYGDAFLLHEKKGRVHGETLTKWRDALSEVGALNGWHIKNKDDRHEEEEKEVVKPEGQLVGALKGRHIKKEANRHEEQKEQKKEVTNVYIVKPEGKLVKELVTKVLSELKKAYLAVSDFLVGVDDSLKEVLGIIGTSTDDIKTVGIHGMGGIGKTTLGKVVYNQLSRDFDHCCFLPDVRDTSNLKGIVHLQNRLISYLSKKTCLRIENKDEGMRTIKERFSRKKVLVFLDDVENESQLTALLGGQGCFGPGSVILITTRNEIALRAFQVKLIYHIGVMNDDRSLQLFSKHAFRSDHPPEGKLEKSKEIVEIAQGLPLLLEVMGSALSLFGQTEEMWDEKLEKWRKGPIHETRSKLMISYEALDLNQRQIFLDIACLFVGDDKNIVMYMWKDCGLCPTEGLEVLQLMSLIKIGEDNKLWMNDQLKELGREIVTLESGGQSRLWDHKNGLDALLSKKNEKLQALRLMFSDTSNYCFTLDEFGALPNLRFLHLDSQHLTDELFLSEATLFWHNKSSVPSLTSSYMNKKQLLPDLRWFSWHNFPQQILQISSFSLSNLVILDFSKSKITHDWSGWKHIKRAKKLKVLNLSECELLTRTPDFTGLLTLERLILEKCKRLAEIHPSIGQLKLLAFLNLNFCIDLRHLPQELGRLPTLKELLLDGTSIREIPNWWVMENLNKLSLDASLITHLPESIEALRKLESLSLNWCENMGKLPYSIKELQLLTELDLWETRIIELPDSMSSLGNLKKLKVSVCHGSRGISGLPQLPKSLTSLAISSPSLVTIPDLSNLINLNLLLLCMEVPDISGPSELVHSQEPMLCWIGRLSKLEVLTLTIPHMTNLSSELGSLLHLKSLHLYSCQALESIPQIPSSISKLHLVDCPSLAAHNISHLEKLSELFVHAAPLQNLSGHKLIQSMLELRKSKDYELDLQERRSKMLEQHGIRKIILGLRTRKIEKGYLSDLGKYKKMLLN